MEKLNNTKAIELEAKKIETQWSQFDSKTNLNVLSEETNAFKTKFREQLKNPCFKALLLHMIEELQEFVIMVTEGLRSNEHVIRRWSTEHSQANEFLLCELPKLLDGNIPGNLKLANVMTKELMTKFKTVRTKSEYLRLSKQHIAHAHKFLRQILPTLPLTDELKIFVGELVKHEMKEAFWAYNLVKEKVK